MNKDRLEGLELFLLDVDGVVILGRTPIKGAADGIQTLRDSGARVMLLTNNSTRSRRVLAKELKAASIEVEAEDIITSAYAATRYVQSKGMRRAYVVGERGLIDELADGGIEMVGEDAKDCDVVLVGLDRALTYKKLATAFRLIRGGARFVATNADATLPTEMGEIPGAASMVHALEASLGKRPIILGKPSPFMARLALKDAGVAGGQCGIVGDRYETDMAMARRVGCVGILVLTGVASLEEAEGYPAKYRPDLVYPSLSALAEEYKRTRIR